jgi:Bacterial regulatory proteins, tetR family.
MAQPKPTVKARRSYDSSRRQERARLNRDRILTAAEQRFLRDGYGTTTIATIAADADVSSDTIYKSFGGKPGIVRAIRNRALEGEGPAPAEQRSDALHERQADARTIIEAWGALTAEVSPRVAPILLLIRAAAASDPDVLELLEEMDEDRLRRMTFNARRLHDAGHLRPGITITHAADVLWTYSAPELYELLVLRRGWTPTQHGRFVADAMINALL